MKKGIILTTGILAINAVIMPMMTGMRRATNLNQFNRTGAQSLGAMSHSMLDGAKSRVDVSDQPIAFPTFTTTAPAYNSEQSFNPNSSPIITSKIDSQQSLPKIDLSADTSTLVNNLQQTGPKVFKSHAATHSTAENSIQIQKRNYSTREFTNTLSSTINQFFNPLATRVKSALIPNFIKYNLKAQSDGKYKPQWKALLQDGHLAIVKSFLQANLVSDKSNLLEQALIYCQPNDLHDILKFYKHDIATINETFERLLDGDNLFTGKINLSIDTIQQLVQAGLSHDLQIKATVQARQEGNYIFTKMFNPQWFTQEFIHQKNIMLQAQDLSSEQKNILLNMYETATINHDLQSSTYQLTSNQIEQIAQSELKFSQIAQYLPIQLFDTRRIFEVMNASITAQILLELNPHFIQKEEKTALQSGVIDKIIKIEQEMESSEYHTFIAGRNWNFNFTQDLWSLVKAAKRNASTMENIVELNPGTYYDDLENRAIKIEDHIKTRQQILKHGERRDEKDQRCAQDGICLNSTIFENKQNSRIYTLDYFIKNYSSKFSGHTPEHIFKEFDIFDMYHKYQKEIKELQELHKKSSQFGELLAVSIHKDKIDSLIYVASPGARKYSKKHNKKEEECKPSIMLKNLYEKNKINYTLKDKTPLEDYFYYLALPGIPGELGRDYKVQSIIHVTDPEAFAEYKHRVAQLFEKLKNDLIDQLPAQDGSQFALFEDYCTEFFNFHQHDGNLYEID